MLTLTQNVAATSLFLANKTEENCYKTKSIIIAVAKVAQKKPNLIIDEQSKEYWRWRDSILMYEELMLEILTFDLNIAQPYDYLFSVLKELGVVHVKPLRHSAWTFCNDTALTTLPIMMEGKDVALAALFCASIQTNEKIDDVDGVPWWVRIKADEGRLSRAVDVLYAFYVENPLKKQDSHVQGSPVFNLENTRRRGETLHSQTDAGSSIAGTPLDLDRGTQSPREKSNGRHDRDDRDAGRNGRREESVSLPPDSQVSRGDSDAGLKLAANDLDYHKDRYYGNGTALMSPGRKRKSAEPELGAEQARKRARPSEEEGEIRRP